MRANHLLIWNARGLNSCARRSVVRDIVMQQRASIVCLQESKVADFSVTLNNDIVGNDFDYVCLPAVGVARGAVISWRRDLWATSSPFTRRFSVSVRLAPLCAQGDA
jgi:exonuclease III